MDSDEPHYPDRACSTSQSWRAMRPREKGSRYRTSDAREWRIYRYLTSDRDIHGHEDQIMRSSKTFRSKEENEVLIRVKGGADDAQGIQYQSFLSRLIGCKEG